MPIAWLAAIRGRAFAGLIAVLWVVAVAVLILSSRGQEAHVRIEAVGDEFAAIVDGRLLHSRSFTAPEAGAVSIVLDPSGAVPSLPSPRGLDRIRITDAATGSILFEDDFSDAQRSKEMWGFDESQFRVHKGALEASARHELPVPLASVSDFKLEAWLRNTTDFNVDFRETAESYVRFTVRPFENLDSTLGLTRNGQPAGGSLVAPVAFDESQILAANLWMVLGPLRWAPLLLAGLVTVTLVLAAVPWPRPKLGDMSRVAAGAALLLACSLFAAGILLLEGPAEGVPHVPDELSYIFQAKIFASGHLWASPPVVEEAFQYSLPSTVVVEDGKWASIYPFAHPLALAPGFLLGVPGLTNPLFAAGCAGLVYLIGRHLYSPRVALLAVFFFAASPFVLMTASTFMSHMVTAFFILVATYLISTGKSQDLRLALIAGLAIGLAFNARPLTGVAVLPFFGVTLATGLLTGRPRLERFREAAVVAAGAALMLGAYLGYRYLLTGDPFHVDPVQGGVNSLGFAGRHSLSSGLSNLQTNLAYLVLVLHNWPVSLGLTLAALPFLLGSRMRQDWLFLLLALCLGSIYVLYAYHGLMHGPRFFFEAMPFIALLSARGVELTALRVSQWSAGIREKLRWKPGNPAGLSVTLTYVTVLALTVLGSANWLFGDGRGWNHPFVPASAAHLRGFNGVDGRFAGEARAAHLENALVLMDACSAWQCYGSVFWLNKPSLDGPVVYAKVPHGEGSRARLLQAYSDREVYEIDPASRQLTVFGTGQPAGVGRPILARDVPVPTPVPEPTADPLAARRRDEQRIEDLEEVARRLDAYLDSTGSFPVSGHLQSLCTYPGDAGCILGSIESPLPYDPPPGRGYVYRSDGAQYFLAVRLEVASELAVCDVELPVELANESSLIYCRADEGSVD